MKFRVADIKKYSKDELEHFKERATLSQGYGLDFCQMLDNRINMIKGRLKQLEGND